MPPVYSSFRPKQHKLKSWAGFFLKFKIGADIKSCSSAPILSLSFFFSMTLHPPVDQGLLIIHASRSHSLRHTTAGRDPLDERSARNTDPYMTTHNTQTSMLLVGFEPTIPASEWQQTHALDRPYSGILTHKIVHFT
jgi:hypothetical protein